MQPASAISMQPRTGDSAGPASTLGWDTVFAAPASAVNQELSQPGVCPESFACTYVDGSINGQFAPWSITGGGGQQINMNAPVTSGVFQPPGGGQSFDLSGCAVQITVHLEFLPQQNQPSTQLLKVQPSGENAVSVTNITFPNPPDIVTEAAIMEGFSDWFANNIADFAYVFASVDLNVELDSVYQWLTPTTVSYAYVQGPDLTSSYLAVLCMVLNHDASGLAPQISANAVPSGSVAGFLINGPLFLQQMVLPNMPYAFAGSVASQFSMSQDGGSIVNQGEIDLAPFKYLATTYYPKLNQLNLSISGDQIQVMTVVRTEVSPGIDAWYQSTHCYQLTLVNQTNGTQRFGYVKVAGPPDSKWHTVSEGIKITEYILAIIGGILALVMIFAPVAAVVLAALVVTSGAIFAAESIPLILEYVIGDDVSGKAPSITPLISNATRAITWGGAGAFQLTSAALSESLQLGGNPEFGAFR